MNNLRSSNLVQVNEIYYQRKFRRKYSSWTFSYLRKLIILYYLSEDKDVITNGDGAVGGAGVTGPIDEDLFDDEDLDELEEDLENLNV